MKQYHKIQTVFKRDEKTKRIIRGDFSTPEFEFLKDTTWVFTEKVDGTNTRVMWNGSAVIFGGKSDDAQIPVHLLYKLQAIFEGTVKKQIFAEVFGTEPIEVCLYGEGYGNKIQAMGKNYIPDGHDFVLFDVNIGGVWLERHNVVLGKRGSKFCVRHRSSGERNNFWKGGITPLNRKIRSSLEYKFWRKAVFERDDYRCFDCGARGVYLEADHIYPFAFFPRLRFMIENGLTRCEKCHRKTPTYGRRAMRYLKPKVVIAVRSLEQRLI